MFNHHSYLSGEQSAEFCRFVAENIQNIELITSRLMLVMGFKLSLHGSIYLRETIKYYYRRPKNAKTSFNKHIYPLIAKNHNADVRSVDRDLRTALNKCYDRGRMLVVNDIFGCEVVSPDYPPTVNEFVSQLVEAIRSFEMEFEAHSI